MCTVLYIPNAKGKYFASLRDESPLRITSPKPIINKMGAIQYISPIDLLTGGTWAGVNEIGNVIILLNGGFKKHDRNSFYQKSRGLIVTELLKAEMPVIDWELMDMKEIEPYTLVVYSNEKLFELVWDGKEKHRLLLDETMPHIFSSSTLYNSAAKQNRIDIFQNWIFKKPTISKISVLEFFKTYTDKYDGFIMNRSELVKTLSYSFIELEEQSTAKFYYYDFINFKQTTQTISLKICKNNCS